MNTTQVKEMLKKHYDTKRHLPCLELKLEECQRKIRVYQEKIKECDYSLTDTLKGISYEGVRVQTSNISKPTENELMRAHNRNIYILEQLEATEKELKEEISMLEGEVKATDELIKNIPEIYAHKVLFERYGRKKSYREIAEDIRYTHTSIIKIERRSIDWLCTELSKFPSSFQKVSV